VPSLSAIPAALAPVVVRMDEGAIGSAHSSIVGGVRTWLSVRGAYPILGFAPLDTVVFGHTVHQLCEAFNLGA